MCAPHPIAICFGAEEVAGGRVGEAAGVYLFNYSIAPELRRSEASRALIAGLADDLAAMPQSMPVAALCVSAEGVRVAERFGLRDHARIEVGGDLETVMLR